ncbi:MAG: RDD family protein [Elusimicrobia bacterium]|nr:RDD family protein [Elusimicrobiota bacterium]
MSAEEILAGPPAVPASHPELGSFWRRFLALLIDIAILTIVGLSLGSIFGSVFSRMGVWARLVGLGVALLYFVPLDGPLAGGATPGKRALGLRVADAQGAPPSWNAAFVRGLYLSVMLALNGYTVVDSWYKPRVILLMLFWTSVIVSIYLMIFERRRRQGAHDMLAGTFVMRAGTTWSAPGPRNPVHAIVLAGWFALSGVAGWIVWRRYSPQLDPLLALRKAVVASVGRDEVGVNRSIMSMKGTVTRSLNISVLAYYVPDQDAGVDILRREIKTVFSSGYPVDELNGISVSVVTGYTLGIASWSRNHYVGNSVEKWRAWLSGADPGPFPLNPGQATPPTGAPPSGTPSPGGTPGSPAAHG